MVNWKACFIVAVACFIGALLLPHEYEFLTKNFPLEEPKEVKQGFDFTIFMLYLLGVGFAVGGIIEIMRSKNNSI